jgi:hypothetical protein
MYNEGTKTFLCGEDLAANRRVKIESGTTTTPPEVVYADAGEDYIGVTLYSGEDGEPIAVKMFNATGTFEVEVAVDSAIAVGTALYGAADGKLSDAASGSVQAYALETGEDDAVIECLLWSIKSTTASTVTIADSGLFTDQSEVEAALQEIYQSLISVQGFVPLSLMQFREVGTMAVGNIVANGGVLASDTTPILQPINGATDGCQRISWAAENVDPIATTIALPPDLDDTADLVLHTRIASEGTTDPVGFTVDTWFNEGDTKVTDTSQTNQTATYAEKITTIAAADVPAGAQTMTISLTPVAQANDDMYLTAAWLEYKTKLRSS